MERNPMFDSLGISSAGMHVQRRIMDVVANNIANARTLRAEDGEPFRRRVAVVGSSPDYFRSLVRGYERKIDLARTHTGHIGGGGWQASEERVIRPARIERVQPVENPTWNYVYDPSHPEADENGYVRYPDVNVLNEMVDMIMATRAYEANLMAFNSTKEMLRISLNL